MNTKQPTSWLRTHGEISALRQRLLEASSNREALKDASRAGNSQQLLDDFQLILDHESDSSRVPGVDDRARLIKALTHLSIGCELFPTPLQVDRPQKDGDPIDFGIAGEVHQGHIAGRKVAVKVFKVYKKRQKDLPIYLKTIRTEAILWCQLYHANIVPCYGAYCDPGEVPRIELVSPWMENGNVATYLCSKENLSHPLSRLLLLSDVASGVAYLHANGIVHGDLKAVNVLVSGSRRACLTDFGISTITDVSGWASAPKTRAPGAPRWHAPELLDTRDDIEIKTTLMSDIYSYGCVCYEIMTEMVPFHETRNETRTQLRIIRGEHPRKPSLDDPAFQKFGLTAELWGVMESCWLKGPGLRPTAKQLCENPVLSSLVDHRPPQKWGEGSIADIRRLSTPGPGFDAVEAVGEIPDITPVVSQHPTSRVDGLDTLLNIIEAARENNIQLPELTQRDGVDSLSTTRALLLQVCASSEMRQELLRLDDTRAEIWMDAFQTVLDSDPSNSQGNRGLLLEALLRVSLARGLPPKSLTIRTPVEKNVEPVDMGPSGELYRGRVSGRYVAIKVLRTFRGRNRVDFKKLMLAEVVISCNLQHENVLPYYGVYSPHWQSGQVGLVSPWMENGNVRDYLRKDPQANRLLLISDVLSGLLYLHKNSIVHGDLEGANILISASGRACLANFSLSVLSGHEPMGGSADLTGIAGVDFGAVGWQAPELFASLGDEKIKITPKSDIYSFGCVFYEVITSKIPFYQKRKILAIPELILAGIRPQKPNPADAAYQEYGLTDEMWLLIETCWRQDSDSRPTALELQQSIIFSSLIDPRSTQEWGNSPVREFRRWAAAAS